jgi:hemoglobin
MSSAPAPTLYDRLGGIVSIDVAVDRLYDRMIGDPELAHFFDDVDLPQLRAHQKSFLATALGGSDAYDGRSLRDAHRHLPISGHHVDRMVGHLAAALAILGVSPGLIEEVVAAVDALRGAVLGRD